MSWELGEHGDVVTAVKIFSIVTYVFMGTIGTTIDLPLTPRGITMNADAYQIFIGRNSKEKYQIYLMSRYSIFKILHYHFLILSLEL